MAYLINVSIEVDALNANEATRLEDRLWKVLLEEDYVIALAMDCAILGTVRCENDELVRG